MKLLIITQKVDRHDPLLGFFHRWVEEFAKNAESVVVICLEKGKFSLPENVKVLSLGKETGESRIKYLVNFYKYIWRERNNYDTIFVHMNQEYVLLGGWFWRVWGKRILMWRNHAAGNWLTRAAVFWSDRVFCTSPQSYTAKFGKTEIMPVGIDTEFFTPNSSVVKKSRSLLFLGRIAPVKRVEVFVGALDELQKRDIEFSATIAGAVSAKDIGYEKMIRARTLKCGLVGKIKFIGSVTQDEALKLYQEHEFYVNLTPAGSMDKTIFEAMACGCSVVASGADATRVAARLAMALSSSEEERKKMIRQEMALANMNNLQTLFQKLKTSIDEKQSS